MIEIAERIANLEHRINLCENLHMRSRGSVCLLAATKSQSINSILTAYQCGLRHFGENYLQEALEKMPLCPDDIIWHFIGPVQSNKTRKLAEHFSWVHSVSSAKIAQRLNDQRPQHLPPLQICIEVNINHESSKFGADASEILEIAELCCTLPHLTLRGLMTIPEISSSVQAFRKMGELKCMLLANGIMIDTLSMGMSNDFELAIAEGATIVRIGSALFGPRTHSIK